MAYVEIKNLIFSYPNSESNALDGVDFSVNEGEICLLIGKSGSGKSTLLKLLKKEIAPYGHISGDISLKTDSIGFVNQNVESNIVMDTVQAELAFAPQNRNKSDSEISLRIAETASYFNLGSVFNSKTDCLSGGTKQIVSLASVLTVKTDLLLLDEPVSQLDPNSAEDFINIILKLNREQGMTVIVSSHRIEHLLSIADKVAVMENGKIIFCGTPSDAAAFLVSTDNDMKSSLPQYTQVFKGNPIDFVFAKREVQNLKYKKREPLKRNAPSLVVKGLCFTYKKGSSDVFFKLDYKAEAGKINAIVGANGCGKTTLLKCLAKILKPYSGKIKADGKVSYLPQNVKTLFLCDTVAEEVNSFEMLEKFNLQKLTDRNPFDLSGGEAQRLALAKIISLDSDILLLDEPTKSVDSYFAEEIAAILKELAKTGKTIVIVTHDLEFAARYADNVSFLFNGQIVASAPTGEFFSVLNNYTSTISKLTDGKAVSIDEIEVEE